MSLKNILVFIFLVSVRCTGQNIDSLVNLRVEWGDTPGIAAAFYANGKTTYYSHGFANAETKETASSKTLFEIGSITKTFTNLLTALMVEKGKISLDDPIQKFLPANVKVPESGGKKITIENLATARSGLPDMPDNFAPADNQNPFVDYTKVQLYEFLNKYTLTREPGSSYEYSNLGMGLLAHTIENQKTFSQLIEEWITRPLLMNQTFLNTPDNKLLHVAQGYAGKTPVKAWTWTNQSVMAGAGGLISNTEDIMKYLIANLNESGPLGKALAMTHQPRHDAGGATMQIGMGWHILNKTIVWHNGGTGGFRTFAGFNSQTKTAVVVLTNSITGADDLGFHLLDSSLPLKTPRQALAVDEKTLKEYVGEYEMSPQFKIAITLKDGSLFAQATGQGGFEIFPESQKKFFYKVVDAQIEFVRDEKGEVEKLLLYQNGAILGARKVN